MIDRLKSLTPDQINIMLNKGTDRPFQDDWSWQPLTKKGIFICRRCASPLFRDNDFFISQCGWPSFDAAWTNGITEQIDADGKRTEIICSYCRSHIGHVFVGENYTKNNKRYCVNNTAIEFINTQKAKNISEALVAAGCFWGVESLFQKIPGVLKTEVGYSGGNLKYPSYEAICNGDTGHYETVRIVFDQDIINLENIYQLFFEIHDFTQINGQGPDIGQQYQSVIFYYNDVQKEIATNILKILALKKYLVATKLLPVQPFWKAENYHQNYYLKTKKQPYCHFRNIIFE